MIMEIRFEKFHNLNCVHCLRIFPHFNYRKKNSAIKKCHVQISSIPSVLEFLIKNPMMKNN